MSNDSLPDWERLLAAAARLQKLIPDAILVGGTAAALYAQHRRSHDADHVVLNLRARFDEILEQLESVAGWSTERVRRPVMILGSLDGIETGIRQLIRAEPLATFEIDVAGTRAKVPTDAEILRIKAALILKRNATRDYIDFAALALHMGNSRAIAAFVEFDRLYPQPEGISALQQLQVQLANPLPFDLDENNLTEYRDLKPELSDWQVIKNLCMDFATSLLDAAK